MAHTTQDDGFHEIQLNGKQLFFLFMAATTISVVIFLLGVMVGRGPRAERGTLAEAAAQTDSPTADPQPLVPGTQPAPAGTDLTMVPPPPTADEAADIRPNNQPDAQEPARKTDKPAAPAPDQAAKPEKPAAPPAASVAAPTATAAQGWAVQVAAVKTKSEADQQVKNLNAKGYVAYVAEPKGGTTLYRVRVGGFKTKREADTAAEKLGKATGVTPWVSSTP